MYIVCIYIMMVIHHYDQSPIIGKSTQIQIVITIYQMEFRLVPNRSVNGKYNLVPVYLT